MAFVQNDRVCVELDDATGCWRALTDRRSGQSLLGQSGSCLELSVDGSILAVNHPGAVRGVQVSPDGIAARVQYEVEGIRLDQVVTLEPHGALLRQQVRIRAVSGPRRALTEVVYRVPALIVGRADQCRLQAPGQNLPPDLPYERAAAMPLDTSAREPHPRYPQGWLESSPDQTAGLVCVENVSDGRCVGTWLHSPIATCFTTLDGDGRQVNVAHRHQLCGWLDQGEDELVSEGFALMLTDGGLMAHLAGFRHATAEMLPDKPDRACLNDLRLLQIRNSDLAHWAARLEEVASLGFNLLYVMPVWSCQGQCVYAIRDHYQIDGRVGTPEQLRAFVDQAHRRGIRVLFDYIPQGIGDSSPFMDAHPQWLVGDRQGRPFGSHGWGPQPGAPRNGHTYSLDWGREDYQQWSIDWALWNHEQFGIDGWRTDALHWKEANFRPDNPHPPWQTSFGGVRLGEKLREALDACHPGSILLSELWGPLFHRSHDIVYQNGWLLKIVNEGWLTGRPVLTARQWRRYLVLDDAARPAGTPRANFAFNHDSLPVGQLARQSALADAVNFLHVFSPGIPFVCWPEIEDRQGFWRSVLAQRASLQGYRCDLAGLDCDADDLFVAWWHRPGGPTYLAAANVSARPVDAAVRYGDRQVQVSLPAGGYSLIRVD